MMLNFVKERPILHLTARMNPREDTPDVYPLPKVGEVRITTFAEAVNYSLESYGTDSKIVKATSEITSLRKASTETSMHMPMY